MNPILIVDDEAAIAMLVRRILTEAGYRCQAVTDSRAAADLLEKNRYDLVLLDVMMPHLDGYDLLAYLRPTGTPCIFITAKDAVAERVRRLSRWSCLQRSWLGDSKTALWCIAFTLLWQAAGYYMVMHIAAMDGISPEIYESATLDGASAWRKLVSITMPLMKDIIGITFVLALSGTINLSFVLSQVMTGGGPNGASSVLLQYMYTQGFVNGNFGYAMAITVFTLAISVALSMLSRKLTDASEGGQ